MCVSKKEERGERMKKQRAALYIRTSTSFQANGADSQEKALIGFVKSKGITNFEIFRDEGHSGRKSSRPEFDRMLELVRSGKFSSICCYSFSRMARSTKQLLDLMNEFKEINVNFISITEAIDTSTSIGRLVFSFIASLSQFEAELVSERVSHGLSAAKARGKRLGAPKKVNTELIRELKSQGYKYREIAKLAGCSVASVGREAKLFSKVGN